MSATDWPRGYTPSRRRTAQLKRLEELSMKADSLRYRHLASAEAMVETLSTLRSMEEIVKDHDLTLEELGLVRRLEARIEDATWRQRG